jgi:carbonic anhydrase
MANISSNNVAGSCNLKCDLAIHYSPSSCPVYHNDKSLDIKYDNTSVPQVTYNYVKYIPNKIEIASPSYFFYNNQRASAEVAIFHTSEDNSLQLIIIVPIIESNSLSNASTFMSSIISGVSSAAPTVGNSTTINLTNFSLSAFVPNKPFYTINSSWGYNIVAFGLESAISLSKSNLTTLSGFFPKNPLKLSDSYDPKQIWATIPIYKNDNGPSSEAAGDIYIDCQPVNESEETTNVPVLKAYDYGFTLDDILNNEYFLAIVVTIVIIIFLLILRTGIKLASSFEF